MMKGRITQFRHPPTTIERAGSGMGHQSLKCNCIKRKLNPMSCQKLYYSLHIHWVQILNDCNSCNCSGLMKKLKKFKASKSSNWSISKSRLHKIKISKKSHSYLANRQRIPKIPMLFDSSSVHLTDYRKALITQMKNTPGTETRHAKKMNLQTPK
jgi:hypothetical protein